MKKVYVSLFFVVCFFEGISQNTYTWNGSGGLWTNASSWSPSRNTPANGDILVFNGSLTPAPSVNMDIISETISRIEFRNGINVTLRANVGGTTLDILNAAGVPALGFWVTSTSRVTFTNSVAGDAVNINIKIQKTGSVEGTVIFDGVSGTPGAGHALTATDSPGALFFTNGSSITYQGNVTGNLFGSSGAANTVVFMAGSKYISKSGASPFGLMQPLSKVIFEKGSLYSHQQTSSPALTGRTYANFEINAGSSFNGSFTGNSPFRCDTFNIITAGTLNFNLPGGFVISGNMNVSSGTINFNPASQSTLLFDGNVPQTVTGNFALNAGMTVAVAPNSNVNLAGTNINICDTTAVYGKLYTNTSTIAGNYFYLPQENYTSNFTGNYVSNTNTITVTTAGGALHAGMLINATDFPANTFITKIVNNIVHLSRYSNASGTGVSLNANSSRGTLGIGSAQGITASGLTGNIQTVSRNFSTTANYEYTGTTAQVTGNGLPPSVKNLILNTTGSQNVTLSGNVNVDDTLSLQRGFLLTTAAVLPLLRDTTAISSPANNYLFADQGWEKSFVAGPIRQTIATASSVRIIPTGAISGADTLFAPVQLTKANSTLTTYTATYFKAPYSDLTYEMGQLRGVSQLEHWTISADQVTPASDAKVGLSWRPYSRVGPTLDSLMLVHYFDDDGPGPATHPSMWHIDGNNLNIMPKSAGATLSYGYLTMLPFADFAATPFTLGTRSPFGDLPLQLLDLEATAQQKNIAVKWITRQEVDVNRYEVEKSINGRDFSMIASVQSVNIASLHNYAATDNSAFEGWNYYRLKVVDNAQHVHYTQVVKVWMGKKDQISIFPNPAQKEIKIILPGSRSITELRIVNSGGQVVKQVSSNQSFLTINIEAFAPGVYFIHSLNGKQATVQRFIKQ